MNLHLTALAAGLLLLLAAPLHARDLVIRGLSLQPGFPGEIHAHLPSGAKHVGLLHVKSFLNHESDTLKFDGNTLVFTAKINPVSATDVNQHLATVEIPAGLRSAIFLFLPAPPAAPSAAAAPAPAPGRVLVIDNSLRAFPTGSFKVFNETSKPVKIQLGKDEHLIKPGESGLIAKVRWGDNQASPMTAYVHQGGQWRMITSTTWTNPGGKRVLQLFTENPAGGAIELKGVRDIAPPEK